MVLCEINNQEASCQIPLPIRCRQRFTTQNDIEIPLSARSPSRILVTDIHIYFGVERTPFGGRNGFFRCRQGNCERAEPWPFTVAGGSILWPLATANRARGLLKSRAFLMRAMPAC